VSPDAAIYALLTDTGEDGEGPAAGIVALVGDRIWPVYDPTVGETRDRLLYQQISGVVVYDCSGGGPRRARYQVTGWSATPEGASALAEAVLAAVSGYQDLSDGILGVFVSGQGDVPALETDEAAQQFGKYVDVELVIRS